MLVTVEIPHPVFKRKKKWSDKDSAALWTWTEGHSLKNVGLSILAICEHAFKTWNTWRTQVEKNRWNPFDDGHGLPVRTLHLQASVRYAQRRSFRFVLFEQRDYLVLRAYLPVIRPLFPKAEKILAWLLSLPYWPRLRLGQYVGSENNRRYFLRLGK